MAVAAALLIALPAAAHMQQVGDLQIIHPWAAPGAQQSSVHPTIVNEGESAVEIVGASTPAAGSAVLRSNGEAVSRLGVAAGVTLTPDDFSIELQGLTVPLPEGAHFPMTLELGDGRTVTFHVVVGESSTMLDIP